MTLRIIPLLLGATVLLRGSIGLATANNHQLSASSTASSPAEANEGIRLRVGASRTADAEQLVDNKIHDKLFGNSHGTAVRVERTDASQLQREKREDIFSDIVLTNNYTPPRVVGATGGVDLQPRITEEVLLVSNLTEERLREENELLEHLNRERPFHAGGSIARLDSEGVGGQENLNGHGSVGQEAARKSPKRKGRRRKGHKKHKHKKLKLLPVTLVGVPVNEDGLPDAGSIIAGLTEASDARWLKLRPNANENDDRRQDVASGGGDGGSRNPSTEIRPNPRPRDAPAEVVDVWKETTMPGSADGQQSRSTAGTAVAGYPPPPVLADGGGEGGQLVLGSEASVAAADKPDRGQRKRENQKRKQLKKANGQRKMPSPPLPPPPPSVTAASASTVTFPADDHNGTETVSVSRVIISGDLSCMRDDFIPAPAIPNADIKYLRNDLYGLENSFLEAEYHCRLGYRLRTTKGGGKDSGQAPLLTSTGSLPNANLVCRRSRWIGKRPACVRIKPAAPPVGFPVEEAGLEAGVIACGKDHRCPQACHRVPTTTTGGGSNRTTVCSCYKGFKMVNHRCVDINECTEYGEDVCEYGCSNTIGSFTCKCPRGLRVTDNNKCMDVNECLLRNGHGPCQDTCINTWSSYRCTCDGLPGTRLAPDGHSCEDIDECTVGNGGCSHTCLNTLGRAFCVCPEGYMLDEDWKTCVDVDECANQHSLPPERRCRTRCLNTVGSFRCVEELEEGSEGASGGQRDRTGLGGHGREGGGVGAGGSSPLDGEGEQYQVGADYDTLCPTGYHFNTTMGDCQDTNECSVANGGCQQHCINSDGSHYCSCKYGFKLDLDKRSCLVLNDSLKLADIACPPLFPPRHGYLECSRPIDEIADGPSGGSLKITNRPGSQCILKCPTGYRPEGKFSKICGTTGEWIGDENGTCIRYPQPKLICPTSVNVELHPNDTESTTVHLRRPETDVSWERDVTAEPYWVKKDSFPLPLGSLNVTLSAKHPVSKLRTDCSFLINVLPGSPPRVDFCPDTQVYTIEGRHQSVKATWEEPVFSDNVGVVTITKSNSPGTDFGAGSHLITYEAHDEAEWKSKCVFKIVVNVSPQQQQQQLPPNGGGQSHFQLPILYNRFYF